MYVIDEFNHFCANCQKCMCMMCDNFYSDCRMCSVCAYTDGKGVVKRCDHFVPYGVPEDIQDLYRQK